MVKTTGRNSVPETVKKACIFYIIVKKDKYKVMAISESQIFLALFIALITGILAVRLGIELYE